MPLAHRSTSLRPAALLLVLALLLTACDPAAGTAGTGTATQVPTSTIAVEASPDPQAGTTPEAEADPEPEPEYTAVAGGDLVLYTTRAESLIKPVVEAFEKQNPGIKMVFLTGSNSQLGAKLLEERNNPRADIFINTDNIAMSALAAEGLFDDNESAAVKSVPQEYRAADGTWVGLTLRPRVIMYNTNLVKPEELPTSVFDLTDPKWKGQVGAADSTNGSMQAQIVAVRALLGESKAEEWVRGLVANDTQFFGGHTDVRKAVGAGELKLGLVNHYYYHLSKAEGAPVGIVYPDQSDGQMGLLVNSTNAAVIEGAQHEDTAEKFVDFLLSPEGQELFAKLNYEYPVVPDVPLAEGVEPLDHYRLANIDLKTLYDEIEPTRELMERAGMP
jgi:iron(III) transport system substrate-binding protein